MSSQIDFSVALVGGGIVGLVCAIALGQVGVEVDIFEAAVRRDLFIPVVLRLH